MPVPLKNLQHRHRMAVALKLDGMKHEQIAEELGTTRNVIDGWMKDKLVKDEIETQSANMLQAIQDKRLSAVNAALDVALVRLRAPGIVTKTNHGEIENERVDLDEMPIDEQQRHRLLLRLLDLDPATRDPKHDGMSGEGSRGLPDPSGGDTFNVLQILGGMTPDQLAETQQKAQAKKAAIEGNGKAK